MGFIIKRLIKMDNKELTTKEDIEMMKAFEDFKAAFEEWQQFKYNVFQTKEAFE